MVPPPPEWHGGVVVAGSIALDRGKQRTPPASLSNRVETDIDSPGDCGRVRDDDDGIDIAANVIEDQLEAGMAKAGTCALDSGLPAQWQHADSGLGLSGVAAASLVASNILCWEDLNMVTRVDWAATRRAEPRFRVFCAVASRLGIVLFRILLAVLGWLPQPSEHRHVGNDAGAHDGNMHLVRLAAIKRSTFDLRLLHADLAEEERLVFSERVGWRWQAAVAAEFYGRFKPQG
jgi:hypothetical protein